MDFKSMLASIWVPFFVLLAFIPGSTLNTIERRILTKETEASEATIQLQATLKQNITPTSTSNSSISINSSISTNTNSNEKTIRQIERKTLSLLNDVINDKTILRRPLAIAGQNKDDQLLQTATTELATETEYQKVIKIHSTLNNTTASNSSDDNDNDNVDDDYVATTMTMMKTLKTTNISTALLTSIETNKSPTMPNVMTFSAKSASNTTGTFEKTNVSLPLESKDLLLNFTKTNGLNFVSTTIRRSTTSRPAKAATTNIATKETAITTTLRTTVLPLQRPREQVTKEEAIITTKATNSVAIENPDSMLIVLEKRTFYNINNNNNNTEEYLQNLSSKNKNKNNNNNKINSSNFNSLSIAYNESTTNSWQNKSEIDKFNIADEASSTQPPPLPTPKFYHDIRNEEEQLPPTSIDKRIEQKWYSTNLKMMKKFDPINKQIKSELTTKDLFMNSCDNNVGCIEKFDATLTSSTPSSLNNQLLALAATATNFIDNITIQKPSLATSTSTTATLSTTTNMPTPKTTTIKLTKKPRRIVATTTLKPPPTVDDYRTITSQAGSHAYLPCNVKQLVKKPISWLRVRDGHILTVDQTTFIADQRFQSVYSSNPEHWSLQIKYVQPKDAGTYECQVSTEPKASAIVYLHVIEPKTELVGESTRHVKAGSQVKLRCIISQALEPPLFINWFYNQKQIYLHNRKGWRTEIERIDLPPETTATTKTTTTTTTTTARTTTMSPTTGATVIMPPTSSPSSSLTKMPQTAENEGAIEVVAAPLTTTIPIAATHFSSSIFYDVKNAGDVTSTVSTMLKQSPPLPTSTLQRTMKPMTTMVALGGNVIGAIADVKQITAASLIIASVSKQDSGNYTCSPSNSAPRTVVLHVLNGEYSASAITSGCSSNNILMAYKTLKQWQPYMTVILTLLWLIKYYVTVDFLHGTCSDVSYIVSNQWHITDEECAKVYKFNCYCKYDFNSLGHCKFSGSNVMLDKI